MLFQNISHSPEKHLCVGVSGKERGRHPHGTSSVRTHCPVSVVGAVVAAARAYPAPPKLLCALAAGLQGVLIGLEYIFTIGKGDRDVEEAVTEMCEKLLVNTVIEDYRYEIEEVAAL